MFALAKWSHKLKGCRHVEKCYARLTVHSLPLHKSPLNCINPLQACKRCPPRITNKISSRTQRWRVYSPKYMYDNTISEGVYGVVHRAKSRETEEIVALKKIKLYKTNSGFPIRLILHFTKTIRYYECAKRK